MKNDAVMLKERDNIIELKKLDPNIYEKYVKLVDYMSTPGNDTSNAGIKKFAEENNIPMEEVNKWKRKREFKRDVADRIREYMYHGDGITYIYKKLKEILDDEKVPASTKANIIMRMAMLDMKREEIETRIRVAKIVRRGTDENEVIGKITPIEYLVEEKNDR